MSKQDSIISLLKEINNTVYNSDIETAVDLVVTENDKEYSPNDYNADAFRSVNIKIPKIKVKSINFNDNCLDDNGNWSGKDIDVTNVTSLYNFGNAPNAKNIDLTGWNTLNVTNLENLFIRLGNNTTDGATIIGIEDFDTSKVTNMYNLFGGMKLSHPLDLRKWDVSNVTRCVYFMLSVTAPSVNLEGLDFSKIDENETLYFHSANIPKINLAYTKHSDIVLKTIASPNTETIVGNYTIDDVISKDIYVFKGIKTHNMYINIYNGNKTLNRASLRAIINGLADRTGQTAQTLILGTTLIAKLTEEDIAIATAKNWTIS